MFSTLKGQIITLLETVTELQEVSSTPKELFAGFPGCYVESTGVESEYNSMSDILRTYYFTIKVFYDTRGATVSEAFTAMDDLVEDILDLFDGENQEATASRTIGKSLGATHTYVNLTPCEAKWSETKDSNFLQVNFKVGVQILTDVS